MSEDKKLPKLSLEPYKGTRDFYPEDQFVQNYIFSVWREVAEKFGYQEYHASILEETALYKAKSGEEIVNDQTYSFTDRGGREVTIRPEMTPTVARLVAQKRKELSFPLRWFSIPNLFRYERPQRGRLREHWQLNVDMFGVEGVYADLEIISVADGILKRFGASSHQYKIRVNNRKFLNWLLAGYFWLNPTEAHAISKLMDRMHKIPHEEFKQLSGEIVKDKAGVLEKVLQAKAITDLPEDIRNSESAREIEVLLGKLAEAGITNAVFDPTLVRGFDYYTGTVFEVFDTNPVNPRSIFGGGRYDDLVGIFGVEKVPGIGFGVGDVTTRDFLETNGLLPAYRPPTHLAICPFDETFVPAANDLAEYLRNQNVHVAVDLTGRKVSAQVKSADKQAIPFVLVIGEREVKEQAYELKHLPTSQTTTVGKEQLARHIFESFSK